MALRNEKVQDKKRYFYQNILQKTGRENSFQMILHFQTYLLLRSNVPHFSTKKESVISDDKILKEKYGYLCRQKIEIYFPQKTFFYIC